MHACPGACIPQAQRYLQAHMRVATELLAWPSPVTTPTVTKRLASHASAPWLDPNGSIHVLEFCR